MCRKSGHIAFDCWHRFDQDFQYPQPQASHIPSSMSAMMSAPYSSIDSTWYPDSGASNHLTSDSHNLMTKAAYTGTEKIHIGDGSGLDIHHIGCSSFKSSFNSKVLSLNQLLHVPSITKNLLSVSKFAADNKVYFVFFPNNCSVHDQVSHNILMEGKLQDGHYAFDPLQFISKPQIQSSQRPFPST